MDLFMKKHNTDFHPISALNFFYVISLLMFFVMDHFLKQTQNPFKKYFPHKDQRLIGVEPKVWK